MIGHDGLQTRKRESFSLPPSHPFSLPWRLALSAINADGLAQGTPLLRSAPFLHRYLSHLLPLYPFNLSLSLFLSQQPHGPITITGKEGSKCYTRCQWGIRGCRIGWEGNPQQSKCHQQQQCTVHGKAVNLWCWCAVSSHFQWRLLAQINCSQPSLRNGTLHSRWKCLDWWQTILYKLTKLW